MAKPNNLSITSYGLKYKLRIAFYLMSILPMLVCMYLVSNYILPQAGLKIDVAATIIISIVIVIIGYFLLRGIFDRILYVCTEARLIASGDFSHKVSQEAGKDEVGVLSDALSQLTKRIRSDMDELKDYSAKTSSINLEIQKRVFVLSNLLNISTLISQQARIEEILKVILEKSRLLANSEIAYLLLKDKNADFFKIEAVDGIKSEYLLGIKVNPEDSIFGKLIKTSRPVILDKENIFSEDMNKSFSGIFKLKNTLALPVYSKGRVSAILGIGNTQDNFLYKKDDIELLDIFAKQFAIALENDVLVHRVEKLEIKDALTGLFNEAFILSRLNEEIKRAIAYQRPCAFILFNIDDFKQYRSAFGSLQAEATLKKVANLIQSAVTDIDRVARIGDDDFAVILPEKNKRYAQKVADDIRKRVEFSFSDNQDSGKKVTLSGGVSENPLDGVLADELILKAKELLNLAKKQGKNCVL